MTTAYIHKTLFYAENFWGKVLMEISLPPSTFYLSFLSLFIAFSIIHFSLFIIYLFICYLFFYLFIYFVLFIWGFIFPSLVCTSHHVGTDGYLKLCLSTISLGHNWRKTQEIIDTLKKKKNRWKLLIIHRWKQMQHNAFTYSLFTLVLA